MDLARHQSALTLLHRVGDKKSSSFQHGCKYCGSYFTTEEHLALHDSQSSCGKKRSGFLIPNDECLVCRAPNINSEGVKHEMIFPKHIYSTSKRLNVQHVCHKCGLYFVSEEIVHDHAKNSFCSKFGVKEVEVENSHLEIQEIEPEVPIKRPRLIREESKEHSIDSSINLSTPPTSSSDHQHSSVRRTRRIKQLIPSGECDFFMLTFKSIERKAFYTICTLFIDRNLVCSQASEEKEGTDLAKVEGITPENIMSVIGEVHLPMVKKLME